MPPSERPVATFGVWYDVDGMGSFAFRRWLYEEEAGPFISLLNAAKVYLKAGGPGGNDLEVGRYMIQRLNRGVSGEAIQAMTFKAEPQPRPLAMKVDLA